MASTHNTNMPSPSCIPHVKGIAALMRLPTTGQAFFQAVPGIQGDIFDTAPITATQDTFEKPFETKKE